MKPSVAIPAIVTIQRQESDSDAWAWQVTLERMLDDGGIERRRTAQELDRDRLPEREMGRGEHGSHPAPAEHAIDAVRVAQHGPDQRP